jgi:hypothetical protein
MSYRSRSSALKTAKAKSIASPTISNSPQDAITTTTDARTNSVKWTSAGVLPNMWRPSPTEPHSQ